MTAAPTHVRDAAEMQASARSWADGPMAAFDLETTGKEPLEARIVTATVVRIRGREKAVTNWLADPVIEIPDEAAAVHGISTEHARAHGRIAVEVLREVRAAIEEAWAAGIPLVGHNVSYDLTVIGAECMRHGLTRFKVTGPVLDTIVLDRGIDKFRKGKRTLGATCQHYGVPLSEEEAHSSDADAIASARIAWKIGKRYPKVGTMPLDKLMLWQALAHRQWADNFGAYLARQGKDDDVSREWPLRESA